MSKLLQKADRAVEVLQAMGVEAKSINGRVCMHPDEAMKLVMTTDEDREQILKHSGQIQAALIRQTKDITSRLARLEQIARHTAEMCARGEHITEGHATGGRSGHYVTHCLVCPYKQEGWD